MQNEAFMNKVKALTQSLENFVEALNNAEFEKIKVDKKSGSNKEIV